MPNSFSRFLDDEELQRVRELYLQEAQDETAAEEPPAELPDQDGEPDD